MVEDRRELEEYLPLLEQAATIDPGKPSEPMDLIRHHSFDILRPVHLQHQLQPHCGSLLNATRDAVRTLRRHESIVRYLCRHVAEYCTRIAHASTDSKAQRVQIVQILLRFVHVVDQRLRRTHTLAFWLWRQSLKDELERLDSWCRTLLPRLNNSFDSWS